MYKIGELSKLCKLPVKTLRYYDSEGLLIPDKIDRFTGYRYYSAARLADCNRIIALKELGFTLDEIKQHMKADTETDLLSLIDTKYAELENVIFHTESQLKKLGFIRQIITEGEKNMFDMVIRSTDYSLSVAYVRKNFRNKQEAYEETNSIKASLPQNIIGRRTVIVNYETEYCDHDFDLAACVEITGNLPQNSVYERKTITLPGDTASLVCRFDELEAAYRSMTRQIEETQCQIIGSFYEIYYTDGTVELKVPVCKLLNTVFESDDINLPFENDPEVIGKWKMLDIVPSKEQFLYGYEKCSHHAWLDELYFLEGGNGYWAVGGWTNGFLYTLGYKPQCTLKNKYMIEQQNGHTLMFLEMKHYKDGNGLSGGMPEIWVYEKVDSKTYTKHDISIHDNVDYPFIPDEEVLGVWKVRDFYNNKDEFDTSKQNFAVDDLFFLKVEFLSDGTCIHTTRQNESRLTWTKGLILYKHYEVASAYEIKIIGDVEYLIIEWKTGDYLYGGGRIYWYIFTR